jgi:hypothetical protein
VTGCTAPTGSATASNDVSKAASVQILVIAMAASARKGQGTDRCLRRLSDRRGRLSVEQRVRMFLRPAGQETDDAEQA